MKLTFLALFILLFNTLNSLSQDLKHQMISSQGASVSTESGLRITQTIGQQSISGNSIGGVVVQQGYQQSFWKILMSQNAIDTKGIKLYPNPASDILYVHFGTLNDLPIHLTLFDLNGRLVFDRNIKIENYQININVSSLVAGMYLIKIKGAKLNYYSKILVH